MNELPPATVRVEADSLTDQLNTFLLSHWPFKECRTDISGTTGLCIETGPGYLNFFCPSCRQKG